MLYNDLKNILPQFRFDGKYESGEELFSGNINTTYKVGFRHEGQTVHYILQHINSYVFTDPAGVMRNIQLVTEHLKAGMEAKGINPRGRMLELILTRDGSPLYTDEKGGFWRAYNYIENATAYDRVEKPEHFFETGRAFGEFQRQLYDFDADQLAETIPGFHDTRRRFYAFVASVAADRAGRVKDLEEEIEFFFDRRKMMSGIVKKLETGELPLRVTHNDTKINNVMLDNDTGKAVCVIDLDTVMPGSALYDYGDAIRFGASTAAEDEPDTSKISMDMGLFEQFTRGFLQETNGFLTQNELLLLPLGIKVITCELAMRFLTDYIDGDRYFKVNSPEHNLIRAHAQMKLLTDVEAKYERMCDMVRSLVAE